MKENCPSGTALRVAMRRAAHQILDDPVVFHDPLALSILGIQDAAALQSDPGALEQSPLAIRLRAFLAARSRCAEDELEAAVRRGVRQYVVLGAGLDTFAYRNPYPEDLLQVFEVDHPATQGWKRSLLEEAGIPIPPTLSFSPVEFESQTLGEALRYAGFNTDRSGFFSWLGVTPYLTDSAVEATLQFVASLPAGSGIVFDYMIAPSLLQPVARHAFEGLARRVAQAGEPFQASFDPAVLAGRLRAMGFSQIEDLGPEALNGRYFRGRSDQLGVGSLSHVMNARV